MPRKPSPTRAPKPPPFKVGERVRYLGRESISTAYDFGPGTLIKHHGMIVEIARVVPGRRGTGYPLTEITENGHEVMIDEDTGEPYLDETKDGYSVYEVTDANGRKHGRAILVETAKDWERVKP